MQQVAQGLASLGRGDDKMLVHMTPGEVRGLQNLAMAHGGSLTTNPHTGLPEAGFLSNILPTVIGIGVGAVAGPWAGAAVAGGLKYAQTGSLMQGLSAGFGAYSGTGLLDSTEALGAQALTAEQVQNQVADYGTQYATLNDNVAKEALLRNQQNSILDIVSKNPGAEASYLDKLRAGASQATSSFDAAKNFALQNKTNLLGTAAAGLGGVGNLFARPGPMEVPKKEMTEYEKRLAQYRLSPDYKPYTPDKPTYYQPVYAAGGGQVPQPSMPLDLSQNYPGSNITKSSYATLPSTQPQEIVDGYGPKINPFTGAEGMAAGGLAINQLPGGLRSVFDQAMAAGAFNAPQGEGSQNVSGASENPDDYVYDPETQQNVKKMAVGGRADAVLSRSPDIPSVGIYHDSDKDTVNKEAYEAAMVRLKKMAGAANIKGLPIAMPKTDVRDLGDITPMAAGGLSSLGGYSDGGRMLKGPGDGMSDDIPASINNKQPARLADGEFVVPADVVSHLGNGSTDAGAKRLYAMMNNVRKARTGRKAQGRQIKAEKYIPA